MPPTPRKNSSTSKTKVTPIRKESKMNFDVFIKNLMRQAEENPILAMGAAAALFTAVTRLVGISVDARNSRAWAQEVARRTMKDGLR